MKKAQINLQFNWIFVIIVGAIIIAFFTGFAIKYKGLQEEKGDIELINSLDNTLTQLQSSYFSTKSILDIKSEFKFKCDSNGVNINVGNKKYSINNMIFSSGDMNGKITVWYVPYKMPFKIANFYYIAPKNMKISLISRGDTQEFAEQLQMEIQKYFPNVDIVSNVGMVNEGKVVLISERGVSEMDGSWVSNIDESLVVVVPNENLYEGKVVVKGENYDYLGFAMLYGAIFAEDYGCVLEGFDELRGDVIDVYIRKAGLIQKSGCNYGGLLESLREFKENPSYELSLQLEKINKNIGGKCMPLF